MILVILYFTGLVINLVLSRKLKKMDAVFGEIYYPISIFSWITTIVLLAALVVETDPDYTEKHL